MKWLLVDGNALFAADWFGYGHYRHGLLENYTQRLRILQSQFGFDRVAVAWDSGNSFRKSLSPVYKTHRGAKPPEYDMLITKVQQAVGEIGIDCLEASGFEGDDIPASLVQVALDEGVQAVICSGDKDLHQCLVPGQCHRSPVGRKPHPPSCPSIRSLHKRCSKSMACIRITGSITASSLVMRVMDRWSRTAGERLAREKSFNHAARSKNSSRIRFRHRSPIASVDCCSILCHKSN